MEVVPQSRIDLFAEMESHYEKEDTEYFVKLLDHDDYVVRCRATCILVDLGGEDKVQYIAKVLKDDPNELVRHEAAFSLGSTGEPEVLEKALNDPEESVRHSAVVALSNLEFMKTLCKSEKFGKLTGG